MQGASKLYLQAIDIMEGEGKAALAGDTFRTAIGACLHTDPAQCLCCELEAQHVHMLAITRCVSSLLIARCFLCHNHG